MRHIPSKFMRVGTALVLVSLALGSASLIAPNPTPATTQTEVVSEQDARFLNEYTDRTMTARGPGQVRTTVEPAPVPTNMPVVSATGVPASPRNNGFRDDDQIIASYNARTRPTATPPIVAGIDTGAVTETAALTDVVALTETVALSETVPLTATEEPPIMTPEEIAAAEASMRDGQARMSRARTQFRIGAIAAAEKEVAQATKALEKVRAERVKQAEIDAAEAQLQTAQADFERVRLENISLVDIDKVRADVQAAEQRLLAVQSHTEPDPALVAIAQEHIATAQQNYITVAGEASARKTAAEQVMNEANAIFQEAQAGFETSAAQNVQAQQGIDPVTGKTFHDAELDAVAQQQHYALALAAAQAIMDDAQAKLNAAVAEFETARAQEVNDVAAAQAAVDQAQAELAQIPQGVDPVAVAQAQQEVDTLRAQLQVAQQKQESTAVAEAQQRVADRQAKVNKLHQDWAAAEPAIVEAQKRLDDTTAVLKQARQNAAGSGGWSWPTYGTLSSGFGKRNLKVNTYHNGIDIANVKNTPIGAARAGTVTEAGWCKGYGFCVKIAHGGGMSSEYGHLASAPPVKAGDVVEAGTMIGLMGTTYDKDHGGYSTGVHLHLTIRHKGQAVDPLAYLP